MAPKGPVSCETWRRISRSVDKVEALQKHVNEMLGCIYKDEYRKVDIYDEIFWQMLSSVTLSLLLSSSSSSLSSSPSSIILFIDDDSTFRGGVRCCTTDMSTGCPP